ncbi:MAG: hypothetical protein DWQ08_05735 [Proteobacteria bacterium]|nr:MAG: hypothetical protein DWQ08_05735 [Pseudomonadota bacterium]
MYWVAVILFVVLQPDVMAQASPSPQGVLARMDRDGDNRVARTEWLGPTPAFGRIDVDGDKFLDMNELENWFGKHNESVENNRHVVPQPQVSTGDSSAEENTEFSEFLLVEQIRLLIVGATVSHVPRGVISRKRSSMLFHADGAITKTAANKDVGRGKWWTIGDQVLCHQYFDIANDSKVCVLLQRKGNRVYHFNPKTRERLPSDPWTIDRAGPGTHLVPGN